MKSLKKMSFRRILKKSRKDSLHPFEMTGLLHHELYLNYMGREAKFRYKTSLIKTF